MKKLLLGLVLVIGLTQPWGWAQESDKKIDPEADTIVKEMCRAYQAIKSYEGIWRVCQTNVIGEDSTKEESSSKIIFTRPNQIHLATTQIIYVSDGKNFWTYLPRSNQYTIRKAPDKIDTTDVTLTRCNNPSLELLFPENNYARFIKDIKVLKPGKPEELNGVKMDVLEIEGQFDQDPRFKKFTSRILVGKTDRLLHRVTIKTSSMLPAKESQTGKAIPIDITIAITYIHKKLNEKIPDSEFKFEAPDDAKLVTKFKKK